MVPLVLISLCVTMSVSPCHPEAKLNLLSFFCSMLHNAIG